MAIALSIELIHYYWVQCFLLIGYGLFFNLNPFFYFIDFLCVLQFLAIFND